MMQEDIFFEIVKERKRQDEQWGGPKHDDKHGVRDWVSYILPFLGKTVDRQAEWGDNLAKAREALIKVAALCVAAIEAIDRKQ